MSTNSEAERALRGVLGVLREYADELILIGGWVPRLHLEFGRAAVSSPRTSFTTEADILIPTIVEGYHKDDCVSTVAPPLSRFSV